MGTLDGVHATGLGGPLWSVTGPVTPVDVTEGHGTTSAGSPAESTVAAAVTPGSVTEGGDRASLVGHLGGSGAHDAAWMPPLTELPERAFQYQIELRVDQETGRVVARVIERESGEVVRQVPPDYVLQLAMYIDAWLGRVLDARA